jgi:hypothetical protein
LTLSLHPPQPQTLSVFGPRLAVLLTRCAAPCSIVIGLSLGLPTLLYSSHNSQHHPWQVAASKSHSPRPPRISLSLPKQDTHSKCRPSSTTRCRRRCEVSTASLPSYLKHHPDGCAWRDRQQEVEHVALVVLRAHCTAQETTCCCDRISSAPFAARYLRLKTPRYTRSPNVVAT